MACRPKPPNKVDFDKFDGRTKQVFATFSRVVDDLMDEEDYLVPMAAARALERNWSLIWPWLVALTRAMVDDPPPSTPEGFRTLKMFIMMASVLLVYTTWVSDHIGDEEILVQDELVPLIESTPGILAILTEIWWRTSEMNLGGQEAKGPLHGIGLYLITLTRGMGTGSERVFTGEALAALESVLNTTCRHLYRAILKGIADEVALSCPDFTILRFHVMYLNMLRSTFPKSMTVPGLVAQGAIRWVLSVIMKLTIRSFEPYESYKHSDSVKALCLGECLQFLLFCTSHDLYTEIPVLDGGFLIHITKLQRLLVDYRHPLPNMPTPPASLVITLLQLFTNGAIHRPIMVRLVRWIRKLEGNRLQQGLVQALTRIGYPEIWSTLVEETHRRASTCRRFLFPASFMCRNEGCTNKEAYSFGSYLRCTGCQKHAYCSASCQKTAWKSHKELCKSVQGHLRAPDGRVGRTPGSLEIAALRYQFIIDIEESFGEKATVISNEYKAKHNVHPVIWLDYSALVLTLETRSGKHAVEKLRAMKANLVGGPQDLDDLSGGLIALGVIPYHGNDSPIVFSHRLGTTPEEAIRIAGRYQY
ncbi:hypothetical protein V5O48_009630 [Marasmius crinis-equi]|uniref:MYND-type domain-containing protein n=1 Tax=Marasmius crinis-equi TaxID=585013 RepID=A0ABR3FAP6_9AGAR